MDLIARFICIWMVLVVNYAVGVEGAAYSEDCSSATCDDTNNICDTGKTNLCICDTGFFRKTSAAECAAQIALKAACTDGHPADQCKDTLAECRDKSGFKCLCKSDNFENKDVTCAAQVGLDGTCDTTDSATDQCSVADTECRDDGAGSKCLCKATHYSDGSACVIKFAGLATTCNSAVSTTDQCSTAETECRDGGTGSKCLCKITHYSDGTACQTKIALKAACIDGNPTDQCKDTLAECRDESGFKCLCKTDNFENKDVTCAAQVGLDGTCDTTDSATDQCSVADTECRDDGAGSKCLCKATHYSDGSACVIRIKPNIACTAAGQCVTHATCDTTDTNTCVCDASYTPSPIISPTMCSGVVKISTQPYIYVVPILVSMMFLLR